ncbi:VapE domain-containing protein [Devosia albogilva]|uniref:VapE domain-containing protein n=1 Tax=Devosia albogilva TaxID=429726 RepID=A0ABW5QKL6_9HYPH
MQHDTDSAVAFLQQVHGDRLAHLAAISIAGKVTARSFEVNKPANMSAWIEQQQGEANVYFHVNEPLAGVADTKVKKEQVARAHFLHVDVDDASSLERIRQFVPRPSVIVFSGGGYQAFWALREAPEDLDRVERCNMQLAADLGGDHCHNVDRIMRVPGTINVPNAKKKAAGRTPTVAFVVEANWERRYSLDDFAEAPHSDSDAAHIEDEDVSEAGVDVLPSSVSAVTRSLIEYGDDPAHPIGSETAHFRSRSEAVFRVACDLARAGCTDATIAGVLINPCYGIAKSVLEKRNPKQYALKQARSALTSVSGGWPDGDRGGIPKPTMRNTVVALQRSALSFTHDLFRHRKMVSGVPLGEQQGELSDDLCVVLRGMIIQQFGFDPKADNVRDAVAQLCLDNGVHPIREMLASLIWDGVPRVGRWLPTYLGAADTELNSAIGVLMLVAAVRRVRQPGTKFDTIVILEGRQGSGKSTALQILAGPDNHADNEILTLGQREQMEAMEGVWIYELSEMSGLSKSEAEKTKAFASRQFDKARMSYGRFAERRGRQAIFVGTTNEAKYLKDRTGNRRFLPVKTGAIDLEALRRDRDQLWAEAARLEAQGEPISLPEELWASAAIEQEERLEDDPWLEKLSEVNGTAAGATVRVATTFLLTVVLGLDVERQHSGHAKRVTGLMKTLGWEATKYKMQGKTVRGFVRPLPEGHTDDPADPYPF